jgi:hypothetical protein
MSADPTAMPGKPPRLGSILGQGRAVDTLTAAIATGRVHHAWIFSGPKGVGKHTAARAFAAALLDPATRVENGRLIEPPIAPAAAQADATHDPALEPRRLLDAGVHPDLHLISKELARFSRDTSVQKRVLSSIPKAVIDEFLLQPIARAATRRDGGLISKAFIIDEAELLDRSVRHAPTQASLLKTLEEPPPGSLLILVTSNEGRLLPTIRSRCQRVTFGLLDEADMRQWVEQTDVAGQIAAIVGEEIRADVLAIRRAMEADYAADRRARAAGQRGTISAPKRAYYETLDEVLTTHQGRSFAPAIAQLPEAALKDIDPQLLERAANGPSADELGWLTRFSGGSPGQFINAALTRLYDWHTTLDPMFRSNAGGYELGMAMNQLVDEWAKAHVKRGRNENRSKEAANLEAINHLTVLLGQRGDEGLRKLLARGLTGDALRESPTVARLLGVIDAIHTSERRLSANVNLEQGLVALGAALRSA